MTKKSSLPEEAQSYWLDSVTVKKYPTLEEDIRVEVCVVGGGITGLTTAYMLAQTGKKVALLEANEIIGGTTGHTSAKLTAQHGFIYDTFLGNFGKDDAKLYYDANTEALEFIASTVKDLQIDCDFSREDAYLFAETEAGAEKIEREAKAYEKLGIDGKVVTSLPIDLAITKALRMPNQAQFHPAKYLEKLAEAFTGLGGEIYENVTALNIKGEEQPTVYTTGDFTVTADKICICSHFPFYEGKGLYAARMYADRAYVLLGKTTQDIQGLYLSVEEPTRSMRSATVNEEKMTLIIGENHRTGASDNTMKHYEALQMYGEEKLGLKELTYRWSAQDVTTLDELPYIGEITKGKSNILIATGYRKWGMTNGTVAALLLADIIHGKRSPYEELFTPNRLNATASMKNFLLQNMKVLGHLVKGKLEIPAQDVAGIKAEEGAVVRIDGERKGVYKSKDGELFIVDTTCTHIGCEVAWNNGEKSWDCPCHGSRFDVKGEVLEGPAEKPLQSYDYKMIDNLTSDDSGY